MCLFESPEPVQAVEPTPVAELTPPPPEPTPETPVILPDENDEGTTDKRRKVESRRSGIDSLRVAVVSPVNTGVNLPVA